LPSTRNDKVNGLPVDVAVAVCVNFDAHVDDHVDASSDLPFQD